MKFNSNSMEIRRTVSQLRDVALVQAGLSPQLLAIKPGTRFHQNRKQKAGASARGQKHKARDCYM